jgi:hypothetical protein
MVFVHEKKVVLPGFTWFYLVLTDLGSGIGDRGVGDRHLARRSEPILPAVYLTGITQKIRDRLHCVAIRVHECHRFAE